MKKETTLDDVLETVKDGFDHVQKEIADVKARMATKDHIERLDGRIDRMDRRLERTDGKVNGLVNVLEKKNVITGTDKEQVLL